MKNLHAGLDVGDRTTAICIVEQSGAIVFETKANTTPESIASALLPFRKSLASVGQEAGTKSVWLHRELSRLKYPMRSIDPYHAHGVLRARLNKTDKNDAHGLALLLAKGMYQQAHVKSDQAVRLRALLLLREVTLRKANDLDASIRTVTKRLGTQNPARSRRRRALPDPIDVALASAMTELGKSETDLRERHRMIDKLIVDHVKHDDLCMRLMTVPGVGPITALTFVTAIDDPHRFKSSRMAAAYFGLTPRLYQSGLTGRSGGISHRGSRSARKALFMAARALLSVSRSNCALRRWGLRLAEAKGNRVAYVACARKLAVLLHHLWITGQEFDPTK